MNKLERTERQLSGLMAQVQDHDLVDDEFSTVTDLMHLLEQFQRIASANSKKPALDRESISQFSALAIDFERLVDDLMGNCAVKGTSILPEWRQAADEIAIRYDRIVESYMQRRDEGSISH